MKPIIKSLVFSALAIFVTSCECEGTIEKSLAGKWEYTIEISFKGTNNTDPSVSETKKFSGTFTWDETLDGYLEGDLGDSYSYLDGFITDDYLDSDGEYYLAFYADTFHWSENGKQYEAFCDWKSVPVRYNMKSFKTTPINWIGSPWVEIIRPDGSEVFCLAVEATLEARKIR